jgi:transcription termination factor Rho
MSVLDRAALEESPLADLHTIASELSIDGYRRLRKPELIEVIVARQTGSDEGSAPADTEESTAAEADEGPAAETDEGSAVAETTEESGDEEKGAARRRRGRRGGRGRSAARDEGDADDDQDEQDQDDTDHEKDRDTKEKSKGKAKDKEKPRSRRGRRTDEAEEAEETEAEDEPTAEDEEEAEATVEGVVELLPNGSGFLRVSPPEPSDDDVYISAAQVKRCELLSGDRVAGPRRPPRRSERFASLVRIDTINDQPAAELASGARFDDLPAAFPSERLRLGSDDPTIKAIEWLTPFGKGSRVAIVGGPRSGKSHALRSLATVLAGSDDGVQLLIALAGVRPEEVSEWNAGPVTPSAVVSFAASQDVQDQTVELVVDQARRIAARGAHAVVLIDSLELLHPHAARKAMAAARNIVDGGSLTVIATAAAPIGGETTVIALDPQLASTGRQPILDLTQSGTLRPELLVGEDGAAAITRARAAAFEALA